jgi:hypothetical protein
MSVKAKSNQKQLYTSAELLKYTSEHLLRKRSSTAGDIHLRSFVLRVFTGRGSILKCDCTSNPPGTVPAPFQIAFSFSIFKLAELAKSQELRVHRIQSDQTPNYEYNNCRRLGNAM